MMTRQKRIWWTAVSAAALLCSCAAEPLPSPFTEDGPPNGPPLFSDTSTGTPLPSDDLNIGGEADTSADTTTPPDSASLSFPQAVGGAFWANPDLYPTIPVHVVVTGDVSSVEVTLGDALALAVEDMATGNHVATVSLADLADGAHTLTATSVTDPTITATATLHLGNQGVQFTDFDVVGRAATPRLYAGTDHFWLAWTDRREEPRRAWLQAVDGAGQGQGEPMALTPPEHDVVYARAVPGATHWAVLYQTPGLPKENHLLVVNQAGEAMMAPMGLDGTEQNGSWGGDLSFDGAGFVAVWRNVDANTGVSRIYWLRVDEATLAVTGPVVVTESGDDDPEGDFLPFAFLSAETLGEHTLITFVRDHYNGLLEMSVGRCQAAVVHQSGTVVGETLLPTPLSLPFGFQAHVYRMHDELVTLWTGVSLYDEELNPPHRIIGGTIDTKIITVPGSVQPQVILQAPTERGEMALIEHPTHYGTMVWTDQRSKEADPINGRIQLMTTSVDADLVAGEPTLIPHARFIQDTSQANGQAAGTNTVLIWLDERHGGTLGNSRPEIYFETIWE